MPIFGDGFKSVIYDLSGQIVPSFECHLHASELLYFLYIQRKRVRLLY